MSTAVLPLPNPENASRVPSSDQLIVATLPRQCHGAPWKSAQSRTESGSPAQSGRASRVISKRPKEQRGHAEGLEIGHRVQP